ncbi:hypothetical protein [Kineococcus rhizosphaerae]|uniref:5-bromo-4-chloroindolyl phosphate hydrolysis protein n=1 Tax=Kineococcus rhizosphaerae TaxID=559628 RepID=A0A2T0R8A6_9ACTN|nr:hypothetical protein [Kineococcus rhizosphaerae]PRY17397.1 hypothetical protein CLV37_102360 [Kineococcus rhizosphaerae]
MSSVAGPTARSRSDVRPSRALRRPPGATGAVEGAVEGAVVRRGAAQAPPELVSRRLRSRTWRAANSWWLAIPAVGLPWLSFLYMGLRARRVRWVLAAIAYLLAFVGAGTTIGLGLVGSELLIVLGALVGTGAWGLGLMHSVMANSTWLRIKAAFTGEPVVEAVPAPAPVGPAAPADPVAALQERLRDVVRTANRAGGRLPDGAVPAVREIEDVLRPLLAHVAKRGADVEELHNLEAIVTEYLPGALEHYLDLPEDYALTNRGPNGATPAEELVNQLGLLVEGSRDLQRAVYDQDARKLSVQGRFLDAKFRRSDLDL